MLRASVAWRNSANGGPINTVADANGVLYLDNGHILNAVTGRDLTTEPGAVRAVGNGRVGAILDGNLDILVV